MIISGDAGTLSGVLAGASASPWIGYFWGPIAFLGNGILGTFLTNGIAQLFDVAGNSFAGLV